MKIVVDPFSLAICQEQMQEDFRESDPPMPSREACTAKDSSAPVQLRQPSRHRPCA